MPRAEQSQATRIVDFFRKSQIDVAVLVLGLCQDAVRERKQKSAEAKARAGVAPSTTGEANTGKAKKAKAAKKAKPRKSRVKAPQAKPNGAAQPQGAAGAAGDSLPGWPAGEPEPELPDSSPR